MAIITWLAGFRATAIRETKQMFLNRQLIFFCFVLPLFWILIVWSLLGTGVMQKVPVALVDQDKTSQSREAIRTISACRAVKFIRYNSPEKAFQAMKSGSVYAVLLLPDEYGRHEINGIGGTIVLWVDENRYAVAGVLSNEIQSALQSITTQKANLEFMRLGATPAQAKRFISVVHDEFFVLGNMETSFLAFLGSNLIPSLIMIGAMFTFVTAFLREAWHNSYKDWIRASSGFTGAAVCGKLLPYFIGYIIIFLFYLALFTGQGGNFVAGSLFLWFLLGISCLIAFAGAAIIVAAIAPTWRMALVISAGYAAPALPFTGFSMPLDSMSMSVAIFGRCLPLTWYIQGQTQAWTLGANLQNMLIPFGGLFCIICITWLCGLPLTRWSVNNHLKKLTEKASA